MENTCFWKRKNVMKRSNCINCTGYDKFCTNYAASSYRERIANQQANEKQESEKPIIRANSAETEKKVIIAEEQPPKKKWYQIFG